MDKLTDKEGHAMLRNGLSMGCRDFLAVRGMQKIQYVYSVYYGGFLTSSNLEKSGIIHFAIPNGSVRTQLSGHVASRIFKEILSIYDGLVSTF